MRTSSECSRQPAAEQPCRPLQATSGSAQACWLGSCRPALPPCPPRCAALCKRGSQQLLPGWHSRQGRHSPWCCSSCLGTCGCAKHVELHSCPVPLCGQHCCEPRQRGISGQHTESAEGPACQGPPQLCASPRPPGFLLWQHCSWRTLCISCGKGRKRKRLGWDQEQQRLGNVQKTGLLEMRMQKLRCSSLQHCCCSSHSSVRCRPATERWRWRW
jgi:hypothetical protein